MTYSLCLQLPNHIKFKRRLDIYANFIPQMIFFQSLFGYLALTIIYKFIVDWGKSTTPAPSLLNMFIAMFLSPGNVDPTKQLYPGQAFVQTVLLGTAAICVPWMLCVKPFVIWREKYANKEQGYIGLEDTPRPTAVSDGELEDGVGVAADQDEDEVMIIISD